MQSYRRSLTLNAAFLTRKSHVLEHAVFKSIEDGEQSDIADIIKLIESRGKSGIFVDTPSVAPINSHGETFLLAACSRLEIASYLLDFYLKKSRDNPSMRHYLWIADTNLRTPLWQAVALGHDKLVEILLANSDQELIATHTDIANGVNCFTLVETTTQTTILQQAVSQGHVNILEQLLKKIASLENAVDLINMTDKKGNSLLHDACGLNNLKIATLLLQHNCYTDNFNNDKQTALHIACQKGNAALVTLLLHHGADLYQKDTQDKRPFDHVPEPLRTSFYDALGQAGVLMGKNLKKAAHKSSMALEHSAPFLAIGTLFAPDHTPVAAITSRKDAHTHLLTKMGLARADKNLREQTETIIAHTRFSIEKQNNPQVRRKLLDFYLPLVGVHKNLQTLITEKYNLDPEFLAAAPLQLQVGKMPLIRVNADENGEQQIDILDVLKTIPLYLNKLLGSLKPDDEETNNSDEEIEEIELHTQDLNTKIALLNKLNDNRDDILQLVQLLNILHDELVVYKTKATTVTRIIRAMPTLLTLVSAGTLAYGIYGVNQYDTHEDKQSANFGLFILCLLLTIFFAAGTMVGAMGVIFQICNQSILYEETQDSHQVSSLLEEHAEHFHAALKLLQQFVDVFHEHHTGAQLDTSLRDLFGELNDDHLTIRNLRDKLKETEEVLRKIMTEEINLKRMPTHHSVLFSQRNLNIFKSKEDNDQTWLLEKRNLFDLV